MDVERDRAGYAGKVMRTLTCLALPARMNYAPVDSSGAFFVAFLSRSRYNVEVNN